MSTGPSPPNVMTLHEQLVHLRAAFDQLAAEARDHWDDEERRFELTDKFIDPALSLDGLLKQVFSMLKQNHDAVRAMERELRRLSGAIEIALETSALDRPAVN